MKLKCKDWIYVSTTIVLMAVIILVSILYITKPASGIDDWSYYDKKVQSFSTQNANLSSGQIVFIGDSITDLYPLDTYYSDLSLATYNRGIAGDVTQGVIDRLQVSLFDIAPQKIVLMIGINDINGGRSAEYIVGNYNIILSTIHEHLPSAQVYCMSILPMGNKITEYVQIDINARNEKVVQINTDIADLASVYSYEYVDLHSHVLDENNLLKSELTDDGIHLNASGFSIWTDVLKPRLV